MRIVVVGSGRMGSQIACEYALAGYDVAVVARTPELARPRIREALEASTSFAVATLSDARAAAQRISIAASFEASGGSAALVVESVPEDFDLKARLLKHAGDQYRDAVLATNTSSLSISRLAREIGHPSRTLGTHYWNPPLLMPMVEVVRGEGTDEATAVWTEDLLRDLGKHPITVRRDVPGFVWNRLQMALIREALWIVENGVADPAMVDEVVRDGLARRWRFLGPFETVALGGIETFRRVAENVLTELSTATELDTLDAWVPEDPELLRQAQSRRDNGLTAELRREKGKS